MTFACWFALWHLCTAFIILGMTAAHTLDRLDSAVLRILQINGRATYDDIGAQIGLSPCCAAPR